MDNTACLIHDVIRGFTAFSGARFGVALIGGLYRAPSCSSGCLNEIYS